MNQRKVSHSFVIKQCTFLKEYLRLRPELCNSTEPLIKNDWRETDIPLPFRGFDKDKYPMVNPNLSKINTSLITIE